MKARNMAILFCKCSLKPKVGSKSHINRMMPALPHLFPVRSVVGKQVVPAVPGICFIICQSILLFVVHRQSVPFATVHLRHSMIFQFVQFHILFLLVHLFQFVFNAVEFSGDVGNSQSGDFGNFLIAFFFQVKQYNGFFQLP